MSGNDCGCGGEVYPFEAVLLPSGASVFGPWLEREADNLRATADLIAKDGSNLTVRLYSKDQEDSGDGSEVSATRKITASTTGRKVQEWNPGAGAGLKELVRYKFQCSTVEGGWVLFRMLGPIWFDTLVSGLSGSAGGGGLGGG